jgi:acyl-CoA synthetase (AMP-forming)/AMP-acid ligase II
VEEVAVVGVPDPEWGEVPSAAVTLHTGATIGEADLLRFCRDRLASYKRPHSIEIWDSLPVNAHGKILKQEVRRRLARKPGDVSV